MASYEFQSTLYRSPKEMCAAIAEMWLCACGANPRADMVEDLKAATDKELADDCIGGWGLDEIIDIGCDPDCEAKTWLASRDADRDDIIAAFADLRKDFDARFPEDDYR